MPQNSRLAQIIQRPVGQPIGHRCGFHLMKFRNCIMAITGKTGV